MKFLLQRVQQASVYIHDTDIQKSIGPGYLIYLGISTQDLEEHRQTKIETFVKRVGKFYLWSDEKNKKNLGLEDIDGELLIISNFTLYGRNKKGKSIDFCHAAPYEQARIVYNYFLETLTKAAISFQAGDFGAYMSVSSVNDGPVNVMLER